MNESEKEIIENYRAESKRCIDHIVKTNFRYFIFSMTSLISIVIMAAMFLFYLYQYDFSVETTTKTVEQSTDGGGDANYIGRDGDITNGKAESDYSGSKKEENQKN